ncbi:hypothetical protein JTE90_028499 [Oedothorax gibbosus]|uniref:Peptidase S1 domain-containing protein n=1 Tax=Oedothorax gibbosus TaxID=931172 RepID=A0AAV6VW44_9ARAC|nr:hypothetical protein JTE90_028499 [Oedothorax gibbosus]
MKLVLLAIICFFAIPTYSEIPRCTTLTGLRGICVVGRFCRVNNALLSRCNNEQRVLYCCPFQTNATQEWSLEDKGSVPIIFPNDAGKLTTLSHAITKDDPDYDYEPGDIVFPVDETIGSETVYNPPLTKPIRHPTSIPSRRNPTTTTSNAIFQDYPKVKPKNFNTDTSLEKNPEDSYFNNEEFEDDEEQFMFETIPMPKTTTPRVPTERSTEFVRSYTTRKTKATTENPVTKFSSTDEDENTPSTTSTDSKLDDKTTVIPEIKNVDKEESNPKACGSAAYSLFIAGGTESNPNQWPWMAAIFQRLTNARPNKFLCGGSLINTRYILTAAHCCVSGATAAPLPASALLVRLGSNAVHDGDSFSISKVKVHSNFSFSGQYNDIAMLRLTTRLASYSDRIAPVCLPYPTLQEADLVDHLATVIGFGAAYLGGGHQQTLHEVTVPIVSTDDCALAYSRIRSAAFLARGSTHVLCAGLKEGGKDSCKSDSGGPLMIPLENGAWTIIGIVSFGYRCAEPGFPGVYTRVTHYLEWIYSNTQD